MQIQRESFGYPQTGERGTKHTAGTIQSLTYFSITEKEHKKHKAEGTAEVQEVSELSRVCVLPKESPAGFLIDGES